MSILFDLVFKMELSKYRVNLVYVSQSDSLNKMAENKSEMSQLKFLILFKDLQDLMTENLIKFLVDNSMEVTSELFDLIQSCLLVVEKFYLILAVKYDNVLTMAYLKYYWNFIQAKLNQLQNALPK